MNLKIPALVAAAAITTFAASGDNVHVYSGGFSLGGMTMLNDSADRAAKSYGVVAWNNNFTVTDHVNLFADAEWYGLSTASFGFNTGMNWQILTGKVSPFLGVGGGFSYFDHNTEFEDGFGLTARAHAGVKFLVGDNLGLSFSVPFRYTVNEARDNSVGFQLGVSFHNKYNNLKKL